jgi:hypothetical protein
MNNPTLCLDLILHYLLFTLSLTVLLLSAHYSVVLCEKLIRMAKRMPIGILLLQNGFSSAEYNFKIMIVS